MSDSKSQRANTRLVHAGRGHLGGDLSPVNPPITRTSTVLYKDMATRNALMARKAKGERVWNYGTSGSQVSFALEDAITEIEGGTRMIITTTFPSLEAMEQLVEMGAEEGMKLALSQVDELLAAMA